MSFNLNYFFILFQMVATEEPPAHHQPENTGAFGKIKQTLLTAQDKGKQIYQIFVEL
jgi:hypothetical protein